MSEENKNMDVTKQQQAEDVSQKKITFEEFAREINKQILYNPSDRSVSRTTRTFSNITRDQIISYLQNPVSNEKNLRNASIYLYQTSTRYKKLIESLACMPMYYYVISPLNYDSKKLKTDSFKKAYQKVCNTLELMNLADECRKMMTVCLREGVFYGVRWLDSTSSFVQKLDPDYCVITHVSDGTFLFSFDCSKLDDKKLSYYPPEFRNMYDAYRETGDKYQMVPPEISVCLKADISIPEYSIPPYSGALTALYDIATAEENADVADELSNYKILHGKIATDSNGVPSLEYNDMLQYYNMLSNNIGDRVGLAVSPFDMKDFAFDKSGAATDVDMIARSVDHYWSTVGSSSVLHGAPNSTAGVTKLSIRNEESYVLGLVNQCARIINRYLKTAFGGSHKFKISFLPITIFNYEDMLGKYKEALNYGVGKIMYCSALGIPQYDIEGMTYIENDIYNIDNLLTPLKTASTQSSSESSSGRPSKDDSDLSESGESTRDNDSNANR